MQIELQLALTFDYLARRIGDNVTYRRFKSESYHPLTGKSKLFWEEVETKAIFIDPTQAKIELPEAIAGELEAVLAVKRSAFKLQPGEQGPIRPSPGDEIIRGSEVWTPDLQGRAYFWSDPRETIWFIAVRKR